jgi:segregation and condensation protein A
MLDLEKIVVNPEWKEMLIDIATKEFNPWDIDVAVLTNRYLEKIKEMERLNLKISANVLLAASILLRYKSDAWKLVEEEENSGIYIPDSIISEPVIPVLYPIMRNVTRRVTLEELISAVEDVIAKEKRKAAKEKTKIVVPESLLGLLRNTEVFEHKLAEFYKKLEGCADTEKLILFSHILAERTTEEVVNNLILLLHLANSQKIAIWQEEFFGEIFISLNGHGENGHG